MNKIRKITFNNHPILNNLCLDFCDSDGNAVDTVIIAGENGCGKSTILECLYNFPAEILILKQLLNSKLMIKYPKSLYMKKKYLI